MHDPSTCFRLNSGPRSQLLTYIRLRYRVRAVREAIGPDVGLMVDAYQQLSVPEAIHLGRMLEPLNLTWFEEPVICHNHEGEAAKKRATHQSPVGRRCTPIAVFCACCRPARPSILMPDVQRMGGHPVRQSRLRYCDAIPVVSRSSSYSCSTP